MDDTGRVPTRSLILASQSPRRRELLLAAGIPHTVRVSCIDESIFEGEDPVVYVRRVAFEKAQAVTIAPDEIILAADTTVVCEGQVMGKPIDSEDARRMLRLLSGRMHKVITGIYLKAIGSGNEAHEETRVWFAHLTPREIDDYVATSEPMDKAGAYGIQGIASRYIDRIEGSYSNVVGLPVARVCKQLKALGFRLIE